MDGKLGTLMGMTAALLGLLLCFSLTARPRTRLYRWTRRVFWSALGLWISGSLGGVGLSWMTWAGTAALGGAGYLTLTVLRLL